MKFSTVLLLLTLLYGTLVSVGGDSSSGDDDNSSGDGDNSSGDGDNSSGDGDGSSSSSSGDGDNSSGDGDGSSSSSSCEETTTPPECPPDWVPYDDSCYWLMDSPNDADHKTWPAARQACQDMGADLAKITNNGTNEFVTESLLRNATGVLVVWIGLRTAANQTSVANLTWLDGTHVVYTNWEFVNGNQEPTGEIEDDCVSVNGAETTDIIGEWFDEQCSASYNFLCQVTPE